MGSMRLQKRRWFKWLRFVATPLLLVGAAACVYLMPGGSSHGATTLGQVGWIVGALLCLSAAAWLLVSD